MSVPASYFNTRTARPAAIRRAARRAREQQIAASAEQVARLNRLLDTLNAEIAAAIRGAAGPDGSVRLATLQQLRDAAAQSAGTFTRRYRDLLDAGMIEAAGIGAGAFSEFIGDAAARNAASGALGIVESFIAADGLQLSDRIWRVQQHTRASVVSAIEQAVIQGDDALRTAERLMREGQGIPEDVRQRMGLSRAEAMVRGTEASLMRDTGAPLNNLVRLLRTEINRAHTEAFVAGLAENDDVAGVRFLLSPNHPRIDVCDMHASVNLHGLGPGVYPLNAHPYPAHPQTLSYLEPVFEDEISDEDRAGRQTRSEWLRGQTFDTRRTVLGGFRKAAAFDRGWVPENALRTPWKTLRPRLEAQGLPLGEIDDLTPETPPRPRLRGVPEPAPKPPPVPVSRALTLLDHKRRGKTVLDTIDQVHQDGVLPRIPIERSTAQAYLGAYRRTSDGRAVNISARTHPGLESTLVHEIGHFLDHQGAYKPGVFASQESPLFAQWRRLVAESPEIRALRELEALSGDPRLLSHLEYMLRGREIWARCYAQYIAVRSGHAGMLGQIRDMVDRDAAAAVLIPRQWQDAHFEPIAAEIDRIFKALGWL